MYFISFLPVHWFVKCDRAILPLSLVFSDPLSVIRFIFRHLGSLSQKCMDVRARPDILDRSAQPIHRFAKSHSRSPRLSQLWAVRNRIHFPTLNPDWRSCHSIGAAPVFSSGNFASLLAANGESLLEGGVDKGGSENSNFRRSELSSFYYYVMSARIRE
jgi:hypothetical protein